MIWRKKREYWAKYLGQQKERYPWEVVRMAKNLFGVRTTMSDLTYSDGRTLDTQQEILDAFQKYHLVAKEGDRTTTTSTIVTSPVAYMQSPEASIRRVHKALSIGLGTSRPSSSRKLEPETCQGLLKPSIPADIQVW